MTIDHSIFEEVRCLKDGKLYAYNLAEHRDMQDDYNLIKCLLIDEAGELTQTEVAIYRKDLLRIENNKEVA
jgi:hypothetical protein